MKITLYNRAIIACFGVFVISTFTFGQVPQLINYQGRVAVSGTNFTGTGQFAFALVDGGTVSTSSAITGSATATVSNGHLVHITVTNVGAGYTSAPTVTITDSLGSGAQATATVLGGVVTGINVNQSGSNYSGSPVVTLSAPPTPVSVTNFMTYWSNDGTSSAGSQPTHAVVLTVNKGLYSVLLGDATLTNMSVVPSTVFTNGTVCLRVWFNDGSHGWQQLSPDQRIAAVGYAMMAGNVADGAITSAKIASGAVGPTQLAVGAVTGTNIANGSITISQLASGAAALNLNASIQSLATAQYVQSAISDAFESTQIVTKSITETRVLSGIAKPDNELSLWTKPNTVYTISGGLYFSIAPHLGDGGVRFNFSGGAAGHFAGNYIETTSPSSGNILAGGYSGLYQFSNYNPTIDHGYAPFATVDTFSDCYTINGSIQTTEQAGPLQFNWSQWTSGTTSTKLLAGSWLQLTELRNPQNNRVSWMNQTSVVSHKRLELFCPSDIFL